jgi:uncharacterized protein
MVGFVGVALAGVIGLAGCGPGSAGDTSAPGTGSTGATGVAAAAAAGSCGGAVHDLASAMRLVTDPAPCPGSVNTLWRDTPGVGARWTMPRFVAYSDGQIPADACGRADANPADFAENAAYCPADDTVAYSVNLLQKLYQSGGAYQPILVLDHELGHRANHLAGTVGVVSRAEENQADCEAGYALRAANKASRLPLKDTFGGALLFYRLGDKSKGWFNTENPAQPGVHGTPRQRATAFADGFLLGINECHKIGRSSTGSIIL